MYWYILILYNKSYLNCVDVAGLDYEKVWYKGLGQVIRKTMVSKALLLEVITKKIMNDGVFIWS